MKLSYTAYVVILVISNRCLIVVSLYGTYLPRLYKTMMPNLKNVTVFRGYDYNTVPILQIHWLEYLDDYIPQRLKYPSFHPREGENLIKRVIAFNGNLYHLMEKVKRRDKMALNYAIPMKNENGPYFLKVDNNYEDMFIFYQWSIQHIEELEKFINDTVKLWSDFNTLLESPQFADFEPDKNNEYIL